MSKYNKKKKKEAANIVVRPTLSRVSILVLKTVVEISKNFKESSVLADTLYNVLDGELIHEFVVYHNILYVS